MQETPFRLVYGADAMIPVEISIFSTRTKQTSTSENDNIRRAELDIVDEDRNKAEIRQKAMPIIKKKYNKRVQPRSFTEQDLILRRTEDARIPHAHGKLAATWEGPYRVIQVLGKGVYKLQTLQGVDISCIWNVSSLKTYFT
ncbi:uncharacterized protein [Arachis hypogaea]|uniref:uncharacterized protein n=1 Tax=Arachis hypogaea TaxID=3818 RepID=UPI003B226E99